MADTLPLVLLHLTLRCALSHARDLYDARSIARKLFRFMELRLARPSKHFEPVGRQPHVFALGVQLVCGLRATGHCNAISLLLIMRHEEILRACANTAWYFVEHFSMPSDSCLQVCHRCADHTGAISCANAAEVRLLSLTCLQGADGVAHARARIPSFFLMKADYSERALR